MLRVSLVSENSMRISTFYKMQFTKGELNKTITVFKEKVQKGNCIFWTQRIIRHTSIKGLLSNFVECFRTVFGSDQDDKEPE